MKRNVGFTLVELLAVIVILAIILAIAIPGISGIITSAKKGAFESDAKMIVAGIDYAALNASINTSATKPASSTTALTSTNITNYGGNATNYTNVYIVDMDPIVICVESAANGTFGAYSAVATKSTIKYLSEYTSPTYASCSAYTTAKLDNAP